MIVHTSERVVVSSWCAYMRVWVPYFVLRKRSESDLLVAMYRVTCFEFYRTAATPSYISAARLQAVSNSKIIPCHHSSWYPRSFYFPFITTNSYSDFLFICQIPILSLSLLYNLPKYNPNLSPDSLFLIYQSYSSLNFSSLRPINFLKFSPDPVHSDVSYSLNVVILLIHWLLSYLRAYLVLTLKFKWNLTFFSFPCRLTSEIYYFYHLNYKPS